MELLMTSVFWVMRMFMIVFLQSLGSAVVRPLMTSCDILTIIGNGEVRILSHRLEDI